jgi:hypothetical protein
MSASEPPKRFSRNSPSARRIMRAMDVSSAWHSATSRSYVWSPTVAETLCVFLSILGRAIARSIARCQIRVSCINLVDAWVVRYGAEVCFAKLAVVSLKTDGSRWSRSRLPYGVPHGRLRIAERHPIPFSFIGRWAANNLGSPLGRGRRPYLSPRAWVL